MEEPVRPRLPSTSPPLQPATPSEEIAKNADLKIAAQNAEPVVEEGLSEFSEIAPSTPLPAEPATVVPGKSATQTQNPASLQSAPAAGAEMQSMEPEAQAADQTEAVAEPVTEDSKARAELAEPVQSVPPVPAAPQSVQPQLSPSEEAVTPGSTAPLSAIVPETRASASVPPATAIEQLVAALPAAPELPPPRRERIVQFMKGYKGGTCFFAKASGLNQERPLLDGFVVETEAIHAIGNAFKTAVGLEPEIAMRRVMEAQCPAVDFIRNLLKNRARPIAIKLNSEIVPETRLLVGKVLDGSWPHTLLFIVDDDGMVQNLTYRLTQVEDGKTFSAEVHPTAQGRSRNQLIFAVASTAALDVPAGKELGAAGPFLTALQSQAAEAGGTLALGYETFRIE